MVYMIFFLLVLISLNYVPYQLKLIILVNMKNYRDF